MLSSQSVDGRLRVRHCIAAILGTASLAGFASLAGAAEEVVELEEVQITGTRIAQSADYVSPNPVTTFDAEDLERLGINNISDAIIQVPQNTSQFQPANTGGTAFYVGSTLANLRGLNPFFGTRTLTLVDTRRFIPTTQGDAVDLNFIPSNLVSRVETVTGGASAAYGSGAISGVVNIILDKRLQGVKLDMDYGITGHGDGDNMRFGLAGGTEFGGGRGHVVVGGEYQKMDVIQSCADARDWCGRGRGLYTNTSGFFGGADLPFTPNIPGQPHFMIVDGLRENQLSRAGVILTNPNLGPAATTWQLNDAGTDIVPFTLGDQGWRSAGGLVVGGDGDRAYTNLTLQPNVERKTMFSHLDYDLTDSVSIYGELSYGKVEGTNNQFGSGQNAASTCIQPDNAYLSTLSPAAQAAIAAADGNGAFFVADNTICSSFFAGFIPGAVPGTVIRKNWQGQNLQVVTTDTEVTRGVLGFNGTLGDNWTWDGYYQYGKTIRDQIGNGYRTNWRYTFATDAVFDEDDNIVCRVTVEGLPARAVGVVDPILMQGCQPLNIFGTGNASQAALDYAFAALTEHNVIRQDVLSATISGRLFDGWAGPISAAFGAEWRKDKLSNDAGDLPDAIRTDFSLQYGDSFAGSTKVVEGFAEFEIPLLADLALAKRLQMNAAVRTAQYKTSGATGSSASGSNKQNITTWKLASVWDVRDWLRFRGSHSRDIRAPNFRELFYSQSIPAGGFFGTVNNPWIIPGPDGQISDPTVWQLSGNTDLSPEKAKTTTVGIVLQPSGALENLQFSMDWYKIKLEGGLALALGGPAAVTACFEDNDPFFCSLIQFGAPRPGQETNPNAQFTNITRMTTLYTNQNPYIAKGIDFSMNYRLPQDLLGPVPGQFLVSASATRMLKQIAPTFRAGFVSAQVDLAGQTGGDAGFLSDVAPAPNWTATAAVTWINNKFTGTIQALHVGGGHMDLQNPKKGPDDPTYDPTLSFSVTDNTNSSYVRFNLNGSYDLDVGNVEQLQVFASINNAFGRGAPFSSGGVGGVNAINYDVMGRTFRLGVRAKF